ncbi:transposase, partial [Salmonella enterica subsp. enterica serovar London]|nr:transposase [Salmonella enterica subsp. enterica serovar London]
MAKEKFDVSFFDLTSKKVSNQPSHKVVTNNLKGIGKFFKGLPSDAVLVAEHTGVYGDTLLKCCMDSNVKIAFVGGYVIHRYRATPDRAKTDVLDCALLRDFGERYPDKLKYKTFPEEALYELRQLARHREMLVEQRKQLITADKS